MKIDRRGTLRLLFAGLAQASFSGTIGCATPALAPRPARALPKVGSKGMIFYCLMGENGTSTLRLEDWETGLREDFTLPIALPHSLAHDSRDPSIVYVFEVFGSCARVDLETGESVVVETHGKTDMFNGHGVHSSSGRELFCTELISGSYAKTTIRDATTLTKIADTPEECHLSHHIVGLPGSNTIACGLLRRGDKSAGGITFYDQVKHEVIRRVELDEPIIHIFPLSDEEVIGIARPVHFENLKLSSTSSSQENTFKLNSAAALDPGPIYYVTSKGHVRKFWNERQKDLMRGGFGIGKYGLRDSFLSSHSASNAVLSWKDGEIAGVLKIEKPETVLVRPDRKEFVVHSMSSAHFYDFETMKRIKTTTFERPIVLLGLFKTSYS